MDSLDKVQTSFYIEPNDKSLDKLKRVAYYYFSVHIVNKDTYELIIKSADKFFKEYQNEQQ